MFSSRTFPRCALIILVFGAVTAQASDPDGDEPTVRHSVSRKEAPPPRKVGEGGARPPSAAATAWEKEYRAFLGKNAAASPYLDDLGKFVDDTLKDRAPHDARSLASELLSRLPETRANDGVRAVVEARASSDDELFDTLTDLSSRTDLDPAAETRRQALLKEVFRRMDEASARRAEEAKRASRGVGGPSSDRSATVTVQLEALEEPEVVEAIARNGGVLRVMLPAGTSLTASSRDAWLRAIPKAWWSRIQLVPSPPERAGRRGAAGFRLPGETDHVVPFRTADGKLVTAVAQHFLDGGAKLGISSSRVLGYARAKYGNVVIVPGAGEPGGPLGMSRVTVNGKDHVLVGDIPETFRAWAEARAVREARGQSSVGLTLTDPKLQETVVAERARVAAESVRGTLRKAQRDLDEMASVLTSHGASVIRVPTLPPDKVRYAPLDGVTFQASDRRAVWIGPEYPAHPLNAEQKARLRDSLKPLAQEGLVVDFARATGRCEGSRCVVSPSP